MTHRRMLRYDSCRWLDKQRCHRNHYRDRHIVARQRASDYLSAKKSTRTGQQVLWFSKTPNATTRVLKRGLAERVLICRAMKNDNVERSSRFRLANFGATGLA